MAIAHVQSKGLDSGSASTANLAFTSNITAASLIIVAARIGDVGASMTSITDTRSNTYARAKQQHGGGETLEIWYAMNSSAGANTVTVNSSGTFSLRWIIHEYSGLHTTAALDQTASNTGASTAADSSNVTTTVADELLFCANCVSGGVTATQGTSYTKRVEIATKVASEDRIVSSTLTTSGSWSLSGSDTWNCGIATFKIAAAGGGTLTVAETDAITVGDLATLELNAFIAQTDALTLGEAVNPRLLVFMFETESVTVGDTLTLGLMHLPTVTDALTLGEVITLTLQIQLQSADSLTVGDTVLTNLVVQPSVTESVSLAETLVSRLVVMPGVIEALTLGETLTPAVFLLPTVSDGLTLGELVDPHLLMFIVGVESVSLGETVVVTAGVASLVQLSVVEPVTLGETLTLRTFLLPAVSDGVTVGDLVTLTLQNPSAESRQSYL